MDRIKDSGSFGPGSNPGGVTFFYKKFWEMESFKVGDRVNFLNDKGGGVVKKIIKTM